MPGAKDFVNFETDFVNFESRSQSPNKLGFALTTQKRGK